VTRRRDRSPHALWMLALVNRVLRCDHSDLFKGR